MKISYMIQRAKKLSPEETFYRGCNVVYESILGKVYGKRIYPLFYKSYRHRNKKSVSKTSENYLAARANPRAGIGHKIANWVSGYWFAKQFGLKHAHIPFCDNYAPRGEASWWEGFLGFYQDETTVADLVSQGYKKVRLPKFEDNNPEDLAMIRSIVDSYNDSKVVFLLEQDTFKRDTSVGIPILREKFYSCPKRKEENLSYDDCCFNIAIHVRRNVVINNRTIDEPEEIKKRRYTGVEYYITVLESILNSIQLERPVKIYLFSQADPKEFDVLKKYGEVKYCFDMDEKASFLHLIYADLLITSKSSFSYSAAVLSNGVIVGIPDYWQDYPQADNWFVPTTEGELSDDQKKNIQIQIERRRV